VTIFPTKSIHQQSRTTAVTVLLTVCKPGHDRERAAMGNWDHDFYIAWA